MPHYPEFHKRDDGLYAYYPKPGMEIIRTINPEGLKVYWRRANTYDETRRMLTWEEINEIGLDPEGIVCRSANGNIIWGDKVIQKTHVFKDGSIEWREWTRETARETKRSRILMPWGE